MRPALPTIAPRRARERRCNKPSFPPRLLLALELPSLFAATHREYDTTPESEGAKVRLH